MSLFVAGFGTLLNYLFLFGSHDVVDVLADEVARGVVVGDDQDFSFGGSGFRDAEVSGIFPHNLSEMSWKE